MTFFTCFIIAVLAGYGAAIVLVEKKQQWPATFLRPPIEAFLGKIHKKLPEMLQCTVCTSFWTTLICDGLVSLYTNFEYVPVWPLSGLVSLALTWTLIELMNALDPVDKSDSTTDE